MPKSALPPFNPNKEVLQYIKDHPDQIKKHYPYYRIHYNHLNKDQLIDLLIEIEDVFTKRCGSRSFNNTIRVKQGVEDMSRETLLRKLKWYTGDRGAAMYSEKKFCPR